jgi:hypothetical protein
MSVQIGDAIVWSLVTSVTGTGMATGIVDSVEYEISPESDEKTHGLDGKVKNRTFADTLERVTVNIIPSAATIASAKSNNIVPAIGAQLAVVDADDTEIAGSVASSNSYHCVSARKSKTAKGKASVSVTMERFETYLPTAA